MTQLSVFMPKPYSETDDKLLSENLKQPIQYRKFLYTLSKEVSPSRWNELKIISSESEFI